MTASRNFGSPHASGSFEGVAVVARDGFDTVAVLGRYAACVYVETLATDGEVLGRSEIAQMRVPRIDKVRICSPLRCSTLISSYSNIDISETCRSSAAITQHVQQVVGYAYDKLIA